MFVEKIYYNSLNPVTFISWVLLVTNGSNILLQVYFTLFVGG